MTKITRRNFLEAAGVATVTAALVACGAEEKPAEEPEAESEAAAGEPDYTAPDPSAYPIDVDAEGTEAFYEIEETRDGWIRATNPNGVEIGVMNSGRIIQVGGLAFRDSNGDGKLDLYEDWRQSFEDRAAALAAMMEAEDIFPLLWAGADVAGGMEAAEDGVGLIGEGSRAGVSRRMANASSYATDVAWINNIQKICEERDKFGVQYFNYSDPYVLFNVPGSVGLAAAMDKDLWRKAGMWQARAWRAAGVRCDLGPQIDVYSNPIGCRLSGSVCEDPALNRDFCKAFGGGMQSTWGDDEATDDLGWGKESCAVMLKHFVGEGSNEGGRNDHTDSGKWNVFPGSNFNAHLIPFLDGGMHLDSKTEQAASIMPCYGIAYDPNDPEALGETVGSAYSEHNISILRNAGWDGMLCTDWMILTHIPWGVKNLTVPERYAKLMKNTISQHGGDFQPEVAKEAYALMVEELGEEEALATMRDNARRMFACMMKVDLFDQPYSDRTVAKEIFENEKAAAFGIEASDKCVIMMKNAGGIISEAGIDGKVYIPQTFTPESVPFFGDPVPAHVSLNFGEGFAENYFEVATDTVNESENLSAEDVVRLTKDDLADVKYAIVKVSSPQSAFDGVEGGQQFNPMGSPDEPYDPPIWKPMAMQYRPFTADGDYVRKESLNPVDEFGEYENRSVFGQSITATNEDELDLVIDIKSKLPEDAKLILIVDASKPMVFSEIEPYADVILMGWGSIYEEAFAHIISGQVEPSGLSPFQMPADMQTTFEQLEDVPRDMTCYIDSEGNVYDFCYGLNWSGVIEDERTATYKVPALTEPETAF